MRTFFAVAVLASLSADSASAVSCGAGTHLDSASDTCVITTVHNQPSRRASDDQPSIDTEDGNIVIAVNGDGKQVGYRIGDKTIYFDDMAESLRGYTAGSIGAINLGYKVGVVDGGSNAVLEYLKEDLSDRVDGIKDAQDAVGIKLATIESDVTAKLNAQNVKAAADLKSTSDSLSNSVNAALKAQTDSATASRVELTEKVADLKEAQAGIIKIMDKTRECQDKARSMNPLTLECCEGQWDKYQVKEKKCVTEVVGTVANPAESCLAIFERHKTTYKNGLFYIKLSNNAVIQAWCKFDGDYPGATLVSRKPGRVNSEQSKTGRMRYPCKHDTGTGSYCKLSDDEINMLKTTSSEKDAYVSLSYKGNNVNRPRCRAFASKACKWSMNGNPTGDSNSYEKDGNARGGCSHSHVRNSGQYCRRGQSHTSYRGLDGHTCGNINYNSNNKFRAGDGGVSHAGNAFNIWEHSGGSHYCGGWDTSWHHVELWIH